VYVCVCVCVFESEKDKECERKFIVNDIADYLIKIISWYVKWHFKVITGCNSVNAIQCIIEQ
jgi:hypothetical protein